MPHGISIVRRIWRQLVVPLTKLFTHAASRRRRHRRRALLDFE